MAVLKYIDPATGEVKKVGSPTPSYKSTLTESVLLASGWSDGVYELEVNGVTTTTNQEILPALNITAEQLEALQNANLQDGGQAAGSVTLKAYGDTPTIDIPIRVIVRGDM